ncbi:MAG: MopE-related protein [Sandaracinaceae bacterium]|nr:MopE-related protein [Sandaracinaceae bacterium]
MRALVLGLTLALSQGCGAPRPPSDGGLDGSLDAPPSTCTSDDACSDGLFCSGEERCAPGEAGADARGCLAGAAPCPSPVCDEDRDTCGLPCPDADGDGHYDAACGGDDCDDGDALRFPGNLEVCDARRDEDCDPTTLGSDADGDGQVADRCCNATSTGLVCGEDCDDSAATIFAGSGPDGCDGYDSDCDGDIDEDPTLRFYRDVDGDEYGVTTDSVAACSAPPGFSVLSGDCDDTRRGVNPSVMEICNGTDDDCDGETDAGCPCTLGETMPCGVTDVGACEYGVATCVMGATTAVWGPCAGAVGPTDERCGGDDEDCDGLMDESAVDARTYYFDGDGDGHGRDAVTVVACSAPAMYVSNGGDCDDARSDVHPGRTEVCDGRDNDCDGSADEGLPTVPTCRDGDGDGFYALTGRDCGPRCATTPGYATVGGDCEDAEARAFPGNPAYYGRPYCTDAGGEPMFDGRYWVCPPGLGSPRPAWDFDCDGAEAPHPGRRTSGCPMLCDAACTNEPVYSDPARPPACGSLVEFSGCHCVGGIAGCGLLAGALQDYMLCR